LDWKSLGVDGMMAQALPNIAPSIQAQEKKKSF
jgi:hypothetical protein